MSLFTETVEIGERGVVGLDDYNNDIYDWVWVESPAWLEQAGSIESDDLQDQSTATMRVYVPLTAPIKHTSQVRWAGDVWEVKGRPGRQPGGFVTEGFRVATIELVEED